MSPGPVVVVLLVLLAFGAITLARLALRRGRMLRFDEVMRTLASRVGGEVRPARWLNGRPSLVFRIRNSEACLELSSNRGNTPIRYTDLDAELICKPHFWLWIGQEGLTAKANRLFGARDVKVGDGRFDSLFTVQSDDETRVRAFLSPRVRAALLELRALEGGDKAWVEVAHAELRVRKQGWMEDPERAGRFLALGTQVVEGYLDALAAAAPEPPEPAGEASCPVCGRAVAERVETCQGCGARHHPECFELNDGCGRCRAKADAA